MSKFLFSVLLALPGCVSPRAFQVPAESDLKAREFPTARRIDAEDVRYLRPYKKLKDIEFIVLKSTSSRSGTRYENFVRASLEQLGFEHVLNDKEFEEMLVQTKVADRVNTEDYYSITGLYKIARFTPNFLFVETKLLCVRSNCNQNLSIIDPVRSEYLVSMDRSNPVWTNLDGEFNYPLANLIRRWYFVSVDAASQNKGAAAR